MLSPADLVGQPHKGAKLVIDIAFVADAKAMNEVAFAKVLDLVERWTINAFL
jgi:hypothetical protein